MELLLVVIGIALIVVGLFFAVGGVAGEDAGAGARTLTLQGPAWLVLVGIGVALLVFASTQDFDEAGIEMADAPTTSINQRTTEESDDPPASPNPPANRTTVPSSSGLTTTESGCVVSIDNPLVSLRESPEPFGQEILRVPKGQHSVLDFRNESFAGVSTRWLKLAIYGQEGWVEDNTIFIASKSDCFF